MNFGVEFLAYLNSINDVSSVRVGPAMRVVAHDQARDMACRKLFQAR